MKDNANLIAVGGVVIIGLGLLVYAGLSGNVLDTEAIKQIAAGLIGFAGGAGAVVIKEKL